MKIKLIIISLAITILFVLIPLSEALAQCAMCRATVENNVSEGAGLAEGLNNGILYLASVPYLIFVTISYLWYRNSKLYRAKQEKISRYFTR